MAVNNCVKYLLFFFNLLFWVSLSCCLLLLPVSAACCASLGSDPQGVASLGEATNLLNPESVTQKS